jgi:hypothetical protein
MEFNRFSGPNNFLQALKALFKDLKVPMNYVADEPTTAKELREFFNNTVNIQMNDIRKLPIKIPSEKELKAFNKKFDECLAIKKEYFAGEIDRAEMNAQLRPIEAEIDEMVNKLYGIEAQEEIEVDELEEEVLVDNESEEDEV